MLTTRPTVVLAAATLTASALADVRITEFMSQGQSPNAPWLISAAGACGDAFQSRLAPSPGGFPTNFPDPNGPWNRADDIDLANPGVDVPSPGSALLAALGIALAFLRRTR